jgi:ElaB/YqjD/DUF883 family membrane-anchored ribosome-binding protein
VHDRTVRPNAVRLGARHQGVSPPAANVVAVSFLSGGLQHKMAAAEPVTTQLTDTAKDMAQGLKEPAQEAMENVKATATGAAQTVKEEGQAAASFAAPCSG